MFTRRYTAGVVAFPNSSADLRNFSLTKPREGGTLLMRSANGVAAAPFDGGRMFFSERLLRLSRISTVFREGPTTTMFSAMSRRLSLQRRKRHRGGNAPLIPLTEAQERAPLCLVRVTASGEPEVQRLCELGLTMGCRLLVIQKGGPGSPMVVRVGECRLCLNREVAQHLWVQPEPTTC